MEKTAISITPKTLWTILLMVIGVFVAWKLRNFLMVVLVSVVIASFVEAGTKTLKRIRVPRPVAVFSLYILGFAIIAGILYLIVPLFVHELAQFVDLFPKNSYVANFLGPLADNGFNSGTFKAILQNKSLITSSADLLVIFQSFFGGFLNVCLVIIISFYLAIQEKGIEQFLRVVSPEKYEDYIVDVWQRTDKKIGYWFGGQALVAILAGVITYIGLFLMSVPYALILAALAGLFVFVPFGTAISVAPAVVLGYLGGGIGLALQIFIFYGVVHYIESYFFTPYILHRTIGMPMLVIILSVIACFELFGLIGVVIAVPIAVLLLELIYDYDKFTKFKKQA
jgi:predicted PurR-regulated permease PerM